MFDTIAYIVNIIIGLSLLMFFIFIWFYGGLFIGMSLMALHYWFKHRTFKGFRI